MLIFYSAKRNRSVLYNIQIDIEVVFNPLQLRYTHTLIFDIGIISTIYINFERFT